MTIVDAKRHARRWKVIEDALADAKMEIDGDLEAAIADAEDAERERDRAEEELATARGDRDNAVAAIRHLLDAAREAAVWMKCNGAVYRVGLPLYELENAIAEAEREDAR